MMGEEFTATTPPEIQVDVAGTAGIGRILIIKNGKEVVYEASPGSAVASFTFTDTDVAPGREYSYYVRVEQIDSHLAWSSPVWVTVR